MAGQSYWKKREPRKIISISPKENATVVSQEDFEVLIISHRRTDETFAMNLQGFIKTVDSALIMLSRQSPNGTWNLEGDWFREGDFFYPSGKGRKAPVSIGQMGKPSKWITLNCYRVLTQTGDLETPLDFR